MCVFGISQGSTVSLWVDDAGSRVCDSVATVLLMERRSINNRDEFEIEYYEVEDEEMRGLFEVKEQSS